MLFAPVKFTITNACRTNSQEIVFEQICKALSTFVSLIIIRDGFSRLQSGSKVASFTCIQVRSTNETILGIDKKYIVDTIVVKPKYIL